jgi:DNA-binding winged helix-turn-helix (wHTH) protein
MISPQRWDNDLRLITNPYSSSMPVTNPAQYYGRRNDLLRVAVSIRNWEPFAITGEPRIGKSSFLYYLTHPDGARKRAEFLDYIGNPAAYLFVLIELQLLPVRNAQGFWRYLFDRLVEEAGKAESLTAEYHLGQEAGSDDYQIQMSFEHYLKQLERKVIFLFDDFDILIRDFERSEVRQITDKLRTLKAALPFKSKLNYVIVSTDPLVQLFEDKGIAGGLSPLSNIINSAPPLGLLEEDAVHELLQEPLQQSPANIPHFSEEDITFINKLSGRYPDFLKISCFHLLEAKIQGSADYNSVWQTIGNDHRIQWLMKRLWERAKQDELPLREVLLQIAQGQVSVKRLAFRELCQRGFVDDLVSPPQIFGELFHEFVLNPDARTLMPTESTPLAANLTPLESKLYNYLLAHVEQTCTREQLQKVIWGDKLPSSPDALEQLVKRLRGKIEPSPDQPVYLLNVRGQGYLLRQRPTK